MKYVTEEAIRSSLKTMNSWHPSVPTFLIFSRQRPGLEGIVQGNTDAARRLFEPLFGLHNIGIDDESRNFYLRVAFGREVEVGEALRGKKKDYGSKLQRTITDTIAKSAGPLEPNGGEFRLKSDFVRLSLDYLNSSVPIDLKPLVLFHFWDKIETSITIDDLWRRFDDKYHVTEPPFDSIFTCSDLSVPAPAVEGDNPPYDIKSIVLPSIFGADRFDIAFWTRFKSILDSKLKALKWQGEAAEINGLSATITAALMHDEALFLVGDPGTGKTTLVEKAILPALREAAGQDKYIEFYSQPITTSTSQTDLFGFQGLDGEWVAGPLTQQLLTPVNQRPNNESSNDGDADESPATEQIGRENNLHVLFFDEANRVDIEGLLSPLQSAFDRMQKRELPDVARLGKTEYIMPRKVWRIFAGNSPAADSGRREQSRPLKRRMSVVVPPNPTSYLLRTTTAFTRAIFDVLEKATHSNNAEVAELAAVLERRWTDNPEYIEPFRLVLSQVAKVPQVALTFGLIESILMRTASHVALNRDQPLDFALRQSLGALLTGDSAAISEVARVAEEQRFTEFARFVREQVLSGPNSGTFEIDPLL